MEIKDNAELKRSLNLWEVVLTGVGIIFGAGIYALIGVMTGIAGNGVWLSVIIGGIISIFTGLSYAFLSMRFSSNSSEYIYISKTFKNETIALLSAYLMIISGIISASLVAIGFGMYLSSFLNLNPIIGAFFLIIICTLILLMGIKESAFGVIIGTLIEVVGLIIIIIFGIPYIENINFEISDISKIFSAGIISVFAFLGFEYITRLSEETRNPEKNIPKGIIISILIALVVYLLVTISSVSILGVENLSKSNAPLADVANKVLGKDGFFILLFIGLFATGNTVLGILLATSRQIHGMSKMQAFIYSKFFIKISSRSVPTNAIIFSSLFSIIFLFISNLKILADLTVLPIIFVFILVNIAAIIQNFKNKKENMQKINKFYLISSLLGLVFCLILFINEILFLFEI
ncbi:MAG: APC family permease [Candidatus Altarchaeaceae archaeon]